MLDTFSLSSRLVVSSKFAKSANVERDSAASQLSSYRVTSRASEVVRQIAAGMKDHMAGRSISITGPYGSGKSSFAVFLLALLESRPEALEKLKASDLDLFELWTSAMKTLVAGGPAPAVGFVTAKRESIQETLSRAIAKFSPGKSKLDPLMSLKQVSDSRPIFLLIDEFGKNLEQYAGGAADSDPYILQEISEMSQGVDSKPIFLITMQHLSFEEYVADGSFNSRREWAKIQGRFHDISFVESSLQMQDLVATAFTVTDTRLKKRVRDWFEERGHLFQHITELSIATNAYPIHPTALAALPDLCAKYGQNERTLFSFVAGSEALAIPALLEKKSLEPNQLPFISLADVYNYFVASASSFVGISQSASRWLEIEMRIRDTHGLSELEIELLKSIAILNLVSTGGALRASHNLLEALFVDRADAFSAALSNLEARNVLSYREFSDEWRIWQGSDFDIRGAISRGRVRASSQDTSSLVADYASIPDLVAGRASQKTGILRVFHCAVLRRNTANEIEKTLRLGEYDGLLLLACGDEPFQEFESLPIPVVILKAVNKDALRERALDLAAIKNAISELRDKPDDWVAQKELLERLSVAQVQLKKEMSRQWTARDSAALLINLISGIKSIQPARNLSELLSSVAEIAYSKAPSIKNEMIAKRELSSQGAKARRLLAEALIKGKEFANLDLEGFGPEVSIYKAIFQDTGIHREEFKVWKLGPPPGKTKWWDVWDKLLEVSFEAVGQTSVNAMGDCLKAPPFGLKSGLVWLLCLAFLIANEDDLVLYEHNSLVLGIDDAVAERFLKNPWFFSFKATGATSGARGELVREIALRFSMKHGAETSFLQEVRTLYRKMRALPPYVFKTRTGLTVEGVELRKLFEVATEPDSLLFDLLPRALGVSPVLSNSQTQDSAKQAKLIAERLYQAFYSLEQAYAGLLGRLIEQLSRAFSSSKEVGTLRLDLQRRVEHLEVGKLRGEALSLVTAILRPYDDDLQWLENLSMVIHKGFPPRQWGDEDEIEFNSALAKLSRTIQNLDELSFQDPTSPHARLVTILSPNGEEQKLVLRQNLEEVAEMLTQIRSTNLGHLSRAELARTLISIAARELESLERGVGNVKH